MLLRRMHLVKLKESDLMEGIEFVTPSGDTYKFRYLTYGEKMDLGIEKAKGTKVQAGQKGFRKQPDKELDASVELDVSVILKIQREAVWKTIIAAPWLKEGQKSTKEMADNKIKGLDMEAINAFVENMNYPKSDVVEKSSGQ